MQKLTYSLLLSLVYFVSFAQETEEIKDFEIRYGSPTINKATPEVIAQVNEVEGKVSEKITLGEHASQEDFDKVCKNLTWITSLEVARHNEGITNIEAIANLTSLEKLKLNTLKASKESPIDLGPLKGLKKLTEIDFYATHVTNTEALSGLTELRDISFYMSNVSSIDFLKTTPNVRTLTLYGFGHTFENYEPVASLKELRELDIYMNKQAVDENLEVLKSLTELRTIRMANDKKVTSLDFLENSTQLETLSASWCNELVDFSALGNMRKLKVLQVSDTKIKNLDMLKGITTLTTIDVSGTEVNDISILSECTDLNSVDISQTAITDISPLSNCEKMWSLSASSSVPEEQTEKLKSINPKMRVRVRD